MSNHFWIATLVAMRALFGAALDATAGCCGSAFCILDTDWSGISRRF